MVSHKTTYALLIYRTGSSELSAEHNERALAGHRALQQQAAARAELHAVARLDPIETAKTVRAHAGTHDITDGPYIDTKEWLVGFYLIDCDSEAEALSRAQTICPVADHAIEVRPVNWRWKP